LGIQRKNLRVKIKITGKKKKENIIMLSKIAG